MLSPQPGPKCWDNCGYKEGAELLQDPWEGSAPTLQRAARDVPEPHGLREPCWALLWKVPFGEVEREERK